METTPEAITRTQDRHSHISIRLQLQDGGSWEFLDAIGWNTVGFNFYFARALEGPQLEFKRGLFHFTGTLAWSAPNFDDEVVQSAIVNELVYKRAKDVSTDASLNARLLRLIRVPGMVEQKRRILASLGLDIVDAKLAQLVDKRKQERPLFHYGVQVQSEVWSAVAEKALDMSSAVIALEAWSKSLHKK
ncbi:hypothetical protein DIC66_20190 [Rhodoferax lacus]|uniref:Uncharacterized protein n=1 Tax=Rhodoferax lacus TaxID=2184758 RepID=A0A3E1R6T9_9BURK|nr:hypothetical protein [Rhodoferax lacus]RFO95079.1 hypothetical protein DIC66_20190 [Rhodoferax lacus]